jgi:hypothetical protein
MAGVKSNIDMHGVQRTPCVGRQLAATIVPLSVKPSELFKRNDIGRPKPAKFTTPWPGRKPAPVFLWKDDPPHEGFVVLVLSLIGCHHTLPI